MVKKRILILGAGLAGLSAAWHLQRKGIDCRVFEKESEVGGLCRSKNISGFTFDYDGHLLHFKHRYTFNFIKDLLENNLVRQKRNAWIYSHDAYIRYPFQANLYGLPLSIVKECLLGFIQASKDNHHKNKEDLNFLSWINQTFGKGIAQHFMIPYNTKFWTLPLERLTCVWSDGFIPVPTLAQVSEGTIEETRRLWGYNARFWYPKRGGINQVSLELASRIKNIHTHCKVVEINLVKKYVRMVSGNKERFDYLISTVPLPELPYLIKGLFTELTSAFKKLRWNSIFNLNLGIEKKDSFRKHWIYFPQREICFFRMGFFHNFSSYLAPAGKSSLYTEVAYSENKPIDKENIVLRIREDLKKIGILNQKDRILAEDINDIKYGYPVYDKNYSGVRKRILKFLGENNIIACGRYGSWRYMSMEDVILNGKEVAESLSQNA